MAGAPAGTLTPGSLPAANSSCNANCLPSNQTSSHASLAVPDANSTAVAPVPKADSELATSSNFDGNTYIFTLTQGDANCPSARVCPGAGVLERLCKEQFTNFICTTAWSSGMVGDYQSSGKQPTIDSRLREVASKECKECANSITILTIRDSPLSGDDSFALT